MNFAHDPTMNFYYLGEQEPHKRIYQEYLVNRSLPLVGIDVETISLKERIAIGVGVSPHPNMAFYFPLFPTESSAVPWHLLKSPKVTKVAHNSIFDLEVLREYDVDATNIGDTNIMSRLLCHKFNGLVDLSFIHQLPVENAGEFMKGLGTKAMIDCPEEAVARKCMYDSMATLRLYYELLPRSDLSYLSTELQTIPIMLEMSARGILIDQEERARLEMQLEAQVESYRQICEEEGFQPGSTQQVGYILAKRGAYNVFPRLPFTRNKYGRKTTRLSTEKEVLEKMEDPLARLILNYRDSTYPLTHYLRPWTNEERATTRFHLDAATGRPSSTQRNMQNIPGANSSLGVNCRGCLLPESGLFTDMDFSQVELRLLAYISQDKEMLHIYESEGDIHQTTADFLGIARKIAKNVNFCLPTTTQALTPSGWKHYNEISQGDWILGYDSGRLIWAPVLDKYHAQAPLLTFGNTYTKLQSTSAHRWYGIRRIHRYHADRYVEDILTTGNLHKEFSIRLSAPANMDRIPLNQIPMSPKDAEIVAWVLTDGERRGRIFQSQKYPDIVEHINMLLMDTPSWIESVRDDGLITWRISSDYIKPLLNWVGDNPELFILRLTDEAREAFLNGCIMAEGWAQWTTKIAQNQGRLSDAIKLAAYLGGNFIKTNNSISYNGKVNQKHTLSSPFMTCQRLRIFDEQPNQPVWCLRTTTGNFVVRDKEQQIFLTGNAMVYGGTDQTLADTAHIQSKERTHQLREMWFQLYPQAGDAIRSWQWDAQHGELTAETIMGRRMRLPDPEDKSLQHTINCSVNYRIQGSAADILKRSLIYCKDLPLALQVHDELLVDGFVDPDYFKPLEHISPLRTPVEVRYLRRWE